MYKLDNVSTRSTVSCCTYCVRTLLHVVLCLLYVLHVVLCLVVRTEGDLRGSSGIMQSLQSSYCTAVQDCQLSTERAAALSIGLWLLEGAVAPTFSVHLLPPSLPHSFRPSSSSPTPTPPPSPTSSWPSATAASPPSSPRRDRSGSSRPRRPRRGTPSPRRPRGGGSSSPTTGTTAPS
jgi:hypothetical protein